MFSGCGQIFFTWTPFIVILLLSVLEPCFDCFWAFFEAPAKALWFSVSLACILKSGKMWDICSLLGFEDSNKWDMMPSIIFICCNTRAHFKCVAGGDWEAECIIIYDILIVITEVLTVSSSGSLLSTIRWTQRFKSRFISRASYPVGARSKMARQLATNWISLPRLSFSWISICCSSLALTRLS